jgi:hypothetical protein
MKAGGYHSADIRRVHDDECKQARNRQGDNQFEETTEQERAEVHCAKNKKTVSGIPENLTVAILAHACP